MGQQPIWFKKVSELMAWVRAAGFSSLKGSYGHWERVNE